jgi:hypothetical protein
LKTIAAVHWKRAVATTALETSAKGMFFENGSFENVSAGVAEAKARFDEYF